MDILNYLFHESKEVMSDSYAKEIGGFYEEMGQKNAAADMKSSILSLIDERIADFEAHLAVAGDYAVIEDPKDWWLAQDDGYMAAQLRNSMGSQDLEKAAPKGLYSAKELTLAGIYARTLTTQLDRADDYEYNGKDDRILGENLRKQERETQNVIDRTNISSKMGEMIKNVFQPFMDKLLEALNQKINKQKDFVARQRWIASGLYRTTPINRAAVYAGYQSA
jgi:hypothetical protein